MSGCITKRSFSSCADDRPARQLHSPASSPTPCAERVLPCCRILPLEAISSTIERNLRELLARNFEVTSLVQQANLFPSASSSAADMASLPGVADPGSAAAGADAAAAATVVVLSGDEFGEMTGATASDVDSKDSGISSSNLISLTASAGDAGAAVGRLSAGHQLPPRRVQFGGATVIDMGATSEGSSAATAGVMGGPPKILRQVGRGHGWVGGHAGGRDG